jgi:hypothetical protein
MWIERCQELIAVNAGAADGITMVDHRSEDAMSVSEPKSAPAISCFSKLRAWWRRRSELGSMDRCELERIACELGMAGSELKELAERDSHAADQLHERMRLLGITTADVKRIADGLMRDIERTCARCDQKGRCKKDVATRPQDQWWGGYCPNASALTSVKCALRHYPVQ